MPDGYFLSEDDRRFLNALKRLRPAEVVGVDAARPVVDDRPVLGRIKKGTTVTPMRQREPGGVEDIYTPGEGVLVVWAARALLQGEGEDVEVLPRLRKLAKGAESFAELGQDTEPNEGDIELTVYNLTPFEIYDIHFVEASLTRGGLLCVKPPTTPRFVAKFPSQKIKQMSGRLCEIGYVDPLLSEAAEDEALEITWLKDADNQPLKRPCVHLGPGDIEEAAGVRMLVHPDAGGVFIIDVVYCGD
jgi:hypothetical protein